MQFKISKVLPWAVIIILASIAVYIIYSYFIYPIFLFSNLNPLSETEVIKDFNTNEERLLSIATYIEKYSGTIIIRKTDDGKYTMSVVKNGEKKILAKIDNEKVNKDILNILYKQKFENILCDENDIEFTRKAGLSYAQSIIYSVNGREPYRGDSYLKKIKDNWYYCYFEDK